MERLTSKVAGEEEAVEAVRRAAHEAVSEQSSSLARAKAQLAELAGAVATVSGQVSGGPPGLAGHDVGTCRL